MSVFYNIIMLSWLYKEQQGFVSEAAVKRNNIFWHFLFAAALLFVWGCSFTPKDKDRNLVKVGKKAVTVFDFKQALELAKTAYPHNMTQNREEFKAVVEGVLHDMVEELVLMNAAESMGVTVTKEAIKAEVDRIRADYPGDSFEKMLMENAIPYDAWEDRVKIQLLMDKVINEALIKNVTISPEEAKEYYNNVYLPEHDGKLEDGITEEQVTRSIIESLKRKKAEEAYEEWLGKIQSQYKIDLNKIEWQKIISSAG
jgi:FKBP-type peptidyl-prolyl cis-trans isomerase (trigger factor)